MSLSFPSVPAPAFSPPIPLARPLFLATTRTYFRKWRPPHLSTRASPWLDQISTFKFAHTHNTMAKIMSLNVHSLNSNRKRHLALREFKHSGADIILLQETHFNKGDSFAFASRQYPQVYQAFNPHNWAGVAILFKSGSPFTCSESFVDPQEHYIILRGQWQTQAITVCTLFLPIPIRLTF